MAIELNDNIKVLAPKPIDSRYFKPNNVPWVSVNEVNLTIPSVERHQGLTVNIAGVEYWYKDDINNGDLVVKSNGISSFNNRTGDVTLLLSDVTTALMYVPANKAGETFTGTVTAPSVIVSGETASTIASFDGSKNIKSLDTATYPSLTELTLLKGITGSTVQTQLNLKAPIASPAFTGKVSLTGSPSSVLLTNSLLNLTQTWDTVLPATPIKLTITDSAVANNGVKLIELIVGSQTMFSIDKIGNLFVFGNLTSSGSVQQNIWNVASGDQFSTIRFKNSATTAAVTKGLVIDNVGAANNVGNPSGTFDLISSDSNFTPVSGNCQFSFLKIGNTINQTGGANGIIRGLYVNPTLTNAADFRAIDVLKGSIVLPYRDETANYAIKTSDYLVNITSGTVTATLPTAVGCQGKHYIIKNSGASSLTLATTSSETIDGSTTLNLNTTYKYVHVVSTGANWIIIANN